ncbi:MAG: beta-ketoacyl synthase chain length factor [Bacteroidales bacterium]|nr:beta-ketoacyl synthase chain length factor [Bacteroidales bacterium]
MEVYISGIGAITTQPDNSIKGFMNPVYAQERYKRCEDPKWSDHFNPMAVRRMSTIIRRALVSSRQSLQEAGLEKPEAIVTGTGLGCIEDTEKFLKSMIEDDEHFMKPTFFIHSTHNTISSQIAINLKCNGYNNTYVHRGTSFEQALQDVFIQFENKRISSAIVGGHDEMTPAYFQLLDRVDYWKKEFCEPQRLCKSETLGSLAGEASISFALTAEPRLSSYAKIKGITTFYNGSGKTDVNEEIRSFLSKYNLTPNDIDVYLSGINGDIRGDKVYYSVAETLFPSQTLAWYKHISLEYFTSAAFGVMAAARCLQAETLPKNMIINNNYNRLKYILLHNHFQNKNHSLILISSCSAF